jgi:GDP-L-fucose synthase
MSRILLLGSRGLVGSAVKRLYGDSVLSPTRGELNLLDRSDVLRYFCAHSIDTVIFAAAKVGGIKGNMNAPYEFIFENIDMFNNVIRCCCSTTTVLFLGSNCIYPRICEQPIKESSLLTGALEPTNQPYALAKIACIETGNAWAKHPQGLGKRRFVTLMPCNLYGQNDNYCLETSHVLPALFRKFTEAVEENKPFVEVWGSPYTVREFMTSDDCARAIKFTLENDTPNMMNVGTGIHTSMQDLVDIMVRVTGYKGEVIYNIMKPTGTPYKVLDVSVINKLGWKAETSLEEGIRSLRRCW